MLVASLSPASATAGDAGHVTAAQTAAPAAVLEQEPSRPPLVAGDLVVEPVGAVDATPQVWGALAKKALVTLLRHGGSKVPGRFGKYATKMANALERLEDLEEVAIATAFMKVGMPPHLAWDAARWCATFL